MTPVCPYSARDPWLEGYSGELWEEEEESRNSGRLWELQLLEFWLQLPTNPLIEIMASELWFG